MDYRQFSPHHCGCQRPEARFTVVTGDMIHRHKNAEQMNAYAEISQHFHGMPVFHIPGNHDMPKCDANAIAQYMAHFGYDRFSFKYGNCGFIGISSISSTYHPI